MTTELPSPTKWGKCSQQSTNWKENPKITIDHYTYRVTWSAEDEEFVGLVSHFPSLSWLAPGQVAALLGIRSLTADVVADLQLSQEKIPVPLADRVYSGEFKLRIPPELNRSLAMQAAEERVSLNRLVAARLAR
ncbi:type II toxin-antitoxin system HicB family antitoxin [Cryobacterium sp. TMS1-13-1]|uniref:type II toxin-antitoxin system HicB family antitoxin n=1 Tax=Cryobacterium sp. TMS1-13-1 TaxID=1259220 RepID=UPI00106D5F8F|nr:toxin-antitoxin system HicB family antitoxin [Cryobacterium sp. TMS1-13-1]TFD23018.1 toxin-antitoxin system HicB family antitoxin [Cryobacterium sp. TMS1-13-1]